MCSIPTKGIALLSIEINQDLKIRAFVCTVTHGAKGNGKHAVIVKQEWHACAHLGGEMLQARKTAHCLVHAARKNDIACRPTAQPNFTLYGSGAKGKPCGVFVARAERIICSFANTAKNY